MPLESGASTMGPHATSETASAVATTLRPLLLGLRRDLQALLPAADSSAAPPRCGLELGRRHAAALHELLERLLGAVRDPSSRAWSGVALAGVGAVGRGAVALGSDLDLRLLASNPTAAAPAAEALLYPLWDLGVAVGHQVVSVDALLEAARDDLPSATALLDWRHIGGDQALHEALLRKAASGLFAHAELPRFMQRLGDEVSQRHARFGGSVYLLEPDVKNGPGGLRDLDVARWAARARFGVAELEDLVRTGALLPREALDLAAAGELLWRIRNLLHAHAGRRSDRLTFDEQEIIAPLLGYQGDPADRAEQLMSDYYRSARTIGRGLDVILTRSTPALTRRRPREADLGDGVRSFDGSITVADADRLRHDPALAMRVMRTAVERAAPLLPWARDAIGRVAHDAGWCAALRSSAEASRIFVDLCASRREVPLKSGTVMRELHDLGLLLAMIPEFSPVVGRVHHDVYHVYTVDVHSVAAVDRLAALVRGDLADEHPLACRLAAEVPRPQTLFFATLLHDVGKAIGGKDHSQRGAEMARSILTRLGFEPEDVDEAAHLILEHLSMYHVATRRDLDDPATVAEFARRMGERETLRDLYLLTVADLSTTSPTSMTSWKASMLDELYLATDAALVGEIADGAGGPGRAARVTELVLAHAREQTRADVRPADAQQRRELEAWLPRYLASMPERYLLSNTPAAIMAHAALARDQERCAPAAGGAGAPVVALVPTRHPGTAEICAVATDRPGLLSAITAAIAASRLEVHAAQIHSRAMDAGGVQAVDLFWVRDRGEGEAGVARALPKLAADLQSVLSGKVDARELARRRGGSALRDRPTPHVSTRVSIDDRASNRHTVIDVLTRDRPGLLFAIADAVYRAGLSIAVAKINTEGTRVADVFYVSEADGSKVARGARAKAVQDAVEAALASLDS